MKFFRSRNGIRLSTWVADDLGQGTVEYILILSFSVMIFLILKGFLSQALLRLRDAMVRKFDEDLFGRNLHRFPVRR